MDFDLIEKLSDIELNDLYNDINYNYYLSVNWAHITFYVRCDNGRIGQNTAGEFGSYCSATRFRAGYCIYSTYAPADPSGRYSIGAVCGSGFGKACFAACREHVN